MSNSHLQNLLLSTINGIYSTESKTLQPCTKKVNNKKFRGQQGDFVIGMFE